MEHIIRVATVINRVKNANSAICAGQLIPLLDNACEQQADIIAAPLYALSGASCGRLFAVPSFQEKLQAQLKKLAQRYAKYNCAILLGLAEDTYACIREGKIHLGKPEELNFICSDATVSVRSLPYRKLPLACGNMAEAGADIYLLPVCHPVKAGQIKEAKNTLSVISKSLGAALVYCNGGLGDTSAPYLYKGFSGIFEDGAPLSFSDHGDLGQLAVCDLDLDIIRACKTKNGVAASVVEPLFSFTPGAHNRLLRPLTMDPYLPECPEQEAEYLDDLFALQVKSLADRLANTGIQRVILGISGGLDSTLAFLVAAAAMDRLNLPRQNIIGVTMPGFGTTGRTYMNAVSLIKSVDPTFREISIADSVVQHLKDIDHDIKNTNVTYENAQARERTQILLDVANDLGALVVGTGDLSEEALGWCTFAGDHISNYNVNVCVTKTMIRKIVARLVEEERFPDANEALSDILNSPVSPELLPPDENGLIVQKTEEILGPYELHDFFLYYFVKYAMPPKKIFAYACQAFDDIMPEFILEKCKLFFRRLFGGQFKRSCTPDSAAITEINLSNAEFYLPSDCSPAEFLAELDDICFDEK